MFALQYKAYGGPEVLTVDEAPDVHPAAGQVRVQVRAASVNPFDWKLRAGFMAQGKPLERPAYLGLDAAGVVDEVGEGVTDVAVGDDVFGLGANTIAEFANLDTSNPREMRHRLPESLLAISAGEEVGGADDKLSYSIWVDVA